MMKTVTKKNKNNNQRRPQILLVAAGIVILIVGIAMVLPNTLSKRVLNPVNTVEPAFHTFRSGSGWGYAITIEEDPIIRQPYIPAIPGETPFKNRKEAAEVAKMVLNKIKRGKNPSISIIELDSLGIIKGQSVY